MEGIDVISAISTVGFPIVAAIALFYLVIAMVSEIKTMVTKNNETNEEIAKTLKEVMAQITDIRIQMAKLETKIGETNDRNSCSN